jgi:beta-lactamase superfamily II metal-dependent hydrolase
MSLVHFLNVKEGDCTWIKHADGKITVMDVCNAKSIAKGLLASRLSLESATTKVAGNFNQKAHPVNPIKYMQDHGVSSVFRFILTHPDMDHMDGIKDFFAAFNPINFWDTANTKVMGSFDGSQYSETDWEFYQSIRNSEADPLCLNLYAGSVGQYWNKSSDGSGGGNGLQILAPTKELVDEANDSEDFNDCSYVLLYRSSYHKILFCGDSHDKTWDYILENHEEDVSDIDLMIAPHHGRKSGRKYDFLDVTKPKFTFFGNAKSQDLAYGAWNNRDLPFFTNNQANCLIADSSSNGLHLYSTNETFARKMNENTKYSSDHQAWWLGWVVED